MDIYIGMRTSLFKKIKNLAKQLIVAKKFMPNKKIEIILNRLCK